MQLNLLAHPAALPSKPEFKVWANVDYAGAFGATATTNIWFGVGAPASRFVIAAAEEPSRADELWKLIETNGSMAMHVSGDFPGLELELWAIRK